MQTLRNRRYDSPRNVFDDRLTDAFYRLYEFFALDYVYGYRNMLEYIWKQYSWSVHDIPDPQDPDTCRYAFLACVCSLLVESSNAKIKMGLPRDAPRIMSPEQAEAYRTTPEDAKTYERIPEWCERVAPLTEPLYVPSHDGVVLGSPDDERAEPAFKAKNIIVLSYHIHFT